MRNPSTSSATTATTTTPSSSSAATKTPCCSKVGLKRGPWTPEEDEILANYINKEGEGRWRTLPKRAGLLRCGKSCRLRWMNYLRPCVKRGQIAPDEEDLILRLHRLLGNRWSLIAGRIPGRTDNEIKNYWNTHLSKKLINQGIDPRTHKPLNIEAPDEQQKQQQKGSSSKTNRKSSSSSSPKLPSASTASPVNPEESSSAGTASTQQVIVSNEINNNSTPGYFQGTTITSVSQLLDQQFNGYTGLLNCEASIGIDLGSNIQHHRINHSQEDDEDINCCTDDVFSSFLNSLINEDGFAGQQHQILQQQQQQTNGLFLPTSDPLVSISNRASSALGFGGAAGWDNALLTSAFGPSDPSRIHDHHVDQ